MNGNTSGSPLRLVEEAFRQSLREIVREELRAAMAEQGGGRPGDTYLSIAKAAQFADVAPGTLRRWIRTGRLSARRAGRVHRISRADLEGFLAREGRGAPVAAKAREILQRA
jgi:excisionase family DNA binding protein